MSKLRDLSSYRRVYFRPELRTCPHCGATLRRSHNAWKKGIQTLKGNLLVTSYAYGCPDLGCHGDGVDGGAVYKSAEAELLSLKHRTYEIDVMVEIGYLRHSEKRSIPEIHASLRSTGVEITERECYELLHVFEELIATRPTMLDPDFYDAIENGGMILAIDGVQPETGNSTLYVLQDVLTEKVLYADYLENSSNENIVPLLEEVKRLGIPVMAIVSDHQHSIRLAVAKVFPGVPHQFCHFHVLRNACQPIIDMDRNLKKEARKAVRGVSAVEKSLKKNVNGDDADLVAFACLILRSILTHPSTVSMNWGGMLVFQRLRALDRMLQRMLSLRNDRELARLARVTSRWKDLLPLYRKVSRLVRYAKELSAILASQDSAEAVEERLKAFLQKVEERAGKRGGGGRDVTVFRSMAKILESHWDGLFHCYRDPRIPRTNNGLEITIRRVKMSYRRMSGRKSWDDFIASYGRSVFMIPPDISREGLLELAERADRRAFEERWREFGARRSRIRAMRRAGTDFLGALLELEKGWTEASKDPCMSIVQP